MKIIDLFKLEEKPKTINYRGFVYVWDDMIENYVVKGYEDTENTFDSDDIFFLANYNLFKVINDEIEIIEEVEDKEYEDIEELDLKDLCEVWNLKEQAFENKINALIRNQKKILERLDK